MAHEDLINTLKMAVDTLPDYDSKIWTRKDLFDGVKLDVYFVKAQLMREYFKVKAVAAEPVQNLVDLDAMLASRTHDLREFESANQHAMIGIKAAEIQQITSVIHMVKMETKKQERRNG